jgi:RNA polymerase sigma-70 factor, ECF subfamily
VRTALTLREARQPGSAPADSPLLATDPELELLKKKYSAEFKRAFQAAVTSLERRDRTLLKLHFVNQVSQESIGKMYRVNGSTISRWLSLAREALLERTRAALQEELSLDHGAVNSLLRLVDSELSLSLARVLR